jgi:hypothetical protein
MGNKVSDAHAAFIFRIEVKFKDGGLHHEYFCSITSYRGALSMQLTQTFPLCFHVILSRNKSMFHILPKFKEDNVGFAVLTAVSTNNIIFYDVTPYCLVEFHQRFELT